MTNKEEFLGKVIQTTRVS